MRVKQKSVRSFEIEVEDLEKIKEFMDKRLEQLKNYPIFIKTSNEEIKNYLNSLNLELFFVSADFQSSNKKIDLDLSKETKSDIIKEKNKILKSKTEIFDRIIRGGEEIISENNLIFLKRINSGAKIKSSSSIEVFDEMNGHIECDGDYLIIRNSLKGTIIFHGEEIKDIQSLSLIDKNGVKSLKSQ